MFTQQLYESFMPTKIIFGVGRIKEIGEYAVSLGENAFLVCDPFLKEIGVTKKITYYLENKGIRVVLFDNIRSNPLCTSVDEASKIMKDENCDFIVAVGGGSTMDTAKGVNVVVSNSGKSWDYVRRSDREAADIKNINYPIITIPTTSGTGSELTPSLVLSNPELNEKSGVADLRLFAKFCICDPELMLTMSPIITASTGYDVIAHDIESYLNLSFSNPFSEMVSLESLKIASKWLPRAYANGSDIEARVRMAWADLLAGMAIAHSVPGLPHAMGMSVAAIYNLPHGLSIAPCLSKVMEWSLIGAPERFANIAVAMDETVIALPLHKKAEKSIELINKITKDVDFNFTFTDLGAKKDEIDLYIKSLYSSWGRFIYHNARIPTKDHVKKLFMDCM